MDVRARAVEDFGKAPNRSGSIIFNTAGPMNADTTKSSANLEIIGVREMGRKCFVIDLAHRGVRQETPADDNEVRILECRASV